jgi:hypothetical protein
VLKKLEFWEASKALARVLLEWRSSLLQVSSHYHRSSRLYIANEFSGSVGLVGYSGQGLYEQVQRARKHRSKKSIREAQIVEGQAQWEITSEEGKRRILQKAKEDLEEFDRVLGVVKLL